MTQNKYQISVVQFCKSHQIEEVFILKLNQKGLLALQQENEEFFILEEQLEKAEKMVRFKYELGLNFAGIEAVSHLLETIIQLQNELKSHKVNL